MYRTTKLVGGKRVVIVGAAISLFVSAGVAAAATGSAPWSDAAPAVHEPTTAASVATDAPIVTDAPAPAVTTSGDAAPGGVEPTTGDATATTDGTTTVTDAPAAEPGTPTSDLTTEPTTASTTEPTMPTITEPAVTEPPATTTPATAAPTTTEFHDTPVPLGISLTCTADGNTVTCHWSGGAIPGFARFLVLRGNGGSQGRVPFQSADPNASMAIDTNVPVGSYSYVVVAVDGNATTLVHSNPVFIQIGAAN